MTPDLKDLIERLRTTPDADSRQAAIALESLGTQRDNARALAIINAARTGKAEARAQAAEAEVERLRLETWRDVEQMRLISLLRKEEGDEVVILSDNPDFNGLPNCAVVCCGGWTDWIECRFAQDTLLDALSAAAIARANHESTLHPAQETADD